MMKYGTCALALLVTGTLITTGVMTKLSPDQPAAAATVPSSLPIGNSVIRLAQPTDPGIGKLTPTKNADKYGMFGPAIDFPTVPIHAALARNGHVITYGTPMNNATTQGGLIFDNWDPAAGTTMAAHMDSDSMGYDSFCNSLVTLQDGNLLMVGGNSSMSTMIYNPDTGETIPGKDLNLQRWYATTLKLTDGQILVLGGTDTYNRGVPGLPPSQKTGTTPEIGDGYNSWTTVKTAFSTAAFGTKGTRWFYPRAFNGPHNSVVGFSGNQLWELVAPGKIRLTGTLPYDPGPSGSQVMYTPGKVLVASGGSRGPVDHITASNRALIINYNTKKPTVTKTGNVRYPGNWLNLTILPNGEVLANGGTKTGTKAGAANSDTTAEIWNPKTGTWSTAATAKYTRTYHSTSLLMASGAVFTGGSGAAPYTDGANSGPQNNMNAELYYPAYLFKKGSDGKVHWAARPAITSIKGSATYGGKITLGLGGAATKITAANLITLPSVTHSQNTDQRRVPLTIKQHGKNLTVTLPKDLNILPPGDYELTVTNNHGIASTAQIITIRKGKSGLITPANQANPAGSTPSPATTMTDMSGME